MPKHTTTRPDPEKDEPIDGVAARAGAWAVFAFCLLLLAIYHRNDIAVLFSDDAVTTTADSPLATCLAARYAVIDNMIKENVATETQINLFRSRAEAMCRNQHPGSLPPESSSR